MSNKIQIFFVTYLFVFPFWVKAVPFTMADSLLNRAEQAYEYEDYPNAIHLYEQLAEQGYFHEKMLYRLAFMHEQAGNYPQSIYYLRKLQWEIGGDHLNDKIDQLMDLGSRSRFSSGEHWSAYRLWINHYQWWLVAAMILLGVIAAGLVIVRLGAIIKAFGLVSAGFSVILGILLIHHVWFYAPKAVIMKSSALYELPAYSSSYQNLPVGKGATVTILDEEDIWCFISMDKFRGWVPRFVLREI